MRYDAVEPCQQTRQAVTGPGTASCVLTACIAAGGESRRQTLNIRCWQVKQTAN